MNIRWKTFFDSFKKNQGTNEEIHENVVEGMDVHGANFIILMCAILIASIGLNMNSPAVIIGAMLISPLMGSIIGIGYGVATYQPTMLNQAFKVLVISILISLGTSTIYFSITPLTTAGSEILARTSPTIWDVMIAFFGGVAGMIGLTRKKSSNVIPGVAIATALMPPLCTVGFGLATGNMKIIMGAGYLFLINCFFIVMATILTTKTLRLPHKHHVNEGKPGRIRKIILTATIIVIIPSMYSAYQIVRQTIVDKNISSFISNEFPNQYILQKNYNGKEKVMTLAVIGEKISNQQMEELEGKLVEYGLSDVTLTIKQNESELSSIEKYLIENKDQLFMPDGQTGDEPKVEENPDTEVELVTEMKLLYPSIKKAYIGEVMDVEIKKHIPVVVMYGEMNDEEKTTIKNWLMLRLKSEEVKVVFAIDSLKTE